MKTMTQGQASAARAKSRHKNWWLRTLYSMAPLAVLAGQRENTMSPAPRRNAAAQKHHHQPRLISATSRGPRGWKQQTSSNNPANLPWPRTDGFRCNHLSVVIIGPCSHRRCGYKKLLRQHLVATLVGNRRFAVGWFYTLYWRCDIYVDMVCFAALVWVIGFGDLSWLGHASTISANSVRKSSMCHGFVPTFGGPINCYLKSAEDSCMWYMYTYIYIYIIYVYIHIACVCIYILCMYIHIYIYIYICTYIYICEYVNGYIYT